MAGTKWKQKKGTDGYINGREGNNKDKGGREREGSGKGKEKGKIREAEGRGRLKSSMVSKIERQERGRKQQVRRKRRGASG